MALSNLLDFLNNDVFFRSLLFSALRILAILVGARILLRVLFVAIHRMELAVEDEDRETVSEAEKRAHTLGSILRKVAQVAVIGVAAAMILRELGLDIAPLITAAGIGGLALGFGAQNLVRDVIAGFFLLVENQVRVGDVVVINGTGGLVEAMNLRTIVLRDLEGTVHIFPNGAIENISNKTKDWARAVIDVGVAYREDVDRVMEVLGQIGEELCQDEAFQPLILEPLQILGVDELGNSQVTIKVMIKTRPLQQWTVGRELRRRIKKRFDAEGIEIPFPQVSLNWSSASEPLVFRLLSSDIDKEGAL